MRVRSLGRTAAWGAAMLAAVAVGWGLRPLMTPPTGGDDEAFRTLVAALASAPQRPVEGRLSELAHLPPPPRLRGPASKGLPPDVRIAAGRLEQLWTVRRTPRNSARLGVAFLALRDWDRAVELLREASEAEPWNPTFQSDLSAAYLERATSSNSAEDWARGLAAAVRAIAIAPASPAAHFNRALALAGLQMPLDESAAWASYPHFETGGPWAAEAAQRADRLRQVLQRTGPGVGDGQVNTQPRREEIEDRLLPGWGQAVLSGDDVAAARALDDVETKAAAMAALGADTMAVDQIALIRRFERDGARSLLRLLARGHVLFGRARVEYVAGNLTGAASEMGRAAPAFRAAGSPYAHWATVYRAIPLRFANKEDEALSLLRSVPLETLPRTYHNLRGRVAWTEGVAWGSNGRPDLEREPITRAIEEYRSARERDHQIMTTTLLAETEWFLGDPARAWSHLHSAFGLVGATDWTNRNYHFIVGALVANGVGLPEVAFEFLGARQLLKETSQSWGERLLERARLRAALGDTTRATADLELAVKAFESLSDPRQVEFKARDVDIARAELFSAIDCSRAVQHADRAYPGLQKAMPTIRIVGLLAVRAKCRQALGDVAGARRDLAEAAAAFECRRQDIGSDLDRVKAFEQERSAYKALLRLEVVRENDPWAGLRTAERSRAGVLPPHWRPRVELRKGAGRNTAACSSDAAGASTFANDADRLPPDVAVVYYESLDDRVLIWVLTRHTRRMLTAPVSPASLQRMVDAIQRAVAQDADLAALAQASAPLVESLIAPALDVADRAADAAGQQRPSTVVFVPDGPLFGIPFGALPAAGEQPLIRRRAVNVAPSLAAFVAASTRLAGFEPSDVLAIGDGHDVTVSLLPRLPGADREVAAVGRLYPRGAVLTGSSATKARILNERRAVMHFAGHTVVNRHNPKYSHMWLAPDPSTDDTGRLMGDEITKAAFPSTGLVVLATCDGAAGPLVDGEGAISVARSFFAAGVPTVVASLWPVVDDLPEFASTLHAQLRSGRNAAQALRQAQLAILDARGPRTPVSVWGGFILFGGHGPGR
jgi:CHAT domain-containing protein